MATPKRFLLRLDPRLFDALRQWAADDLRSVNAQIEYLLAERTRRAGRLPASRARRPNGGNGSEPAATDAEGEPVAGDRVRANGSAPPAELPASLPG
jgi:hypothetical protein